MERTAIGFRQSHVKPLAHCCQKSYVSAHLHCGSQDKPRRARGYARRIPHPTHSRKNMMLSKPGGPKGSSMYTFGAMCEPHCAQYDFASRSSVP